jgi:hypothetical protein
MLVTVALILRVTNIHFIKTWFMSWQNKCSSAKKSPSWLHIQTSQTLWRGSVLQVEMCTFSPNNRQTLTYNKISDFKILYYKGLIVYLHLIYTSEHEPLKANIIQSLSATCCEPSENCSTVYSTLQLELLLWQCNNIPYLHEHQLHLHTAGKNYCYLLRTMNKGTLHTCMKHDHHECNIK